MRKIATIPARDREALFRNTAAKMGMSEAIIEKDFRVCYMLDYLFHRCEWKDNLAFKGGTSLSKAYGLIERFSEDIFMHKSIRKKVKRCLRLPYVTMKKSFGMQRSRC